MSQETVVKLVHEAEAQRQHVRLKLPLKAEIGQSVYRVTDWSVGGFALEGLRETPRVGAVFDVRLLFAFEAYEFAIRARAEVRHAAPTRSRVGFRFLELTAQNLSLLQYIVDAYLSGEVVQAGDLLEVTSRNMFVSSRKPPRPVEPKGEREKLFKRVRAVLSTGLLILLGLSLAGYSAFALYDRLLVVKAGGFIVSPDMQVLRTGTAGTVLSYGAVKGRAVEPKELIGLLQSPEGKMMPIEATCRCFLANEPLATGSYVGRGEVVARLVPEAGTARVEAHLPLAALAGIDKGDRAALNFFTGDRALWGTIVAVERYAPLDIERLNAAKEAYGVVRVVPDQALPVSLVGEPVALHLHKLNLEQRG